MNYSRIGRKLQCVYSKSQHVRLCDIVEEKDMENDLLIEPREAGETIKTTREGKGRARDGERDTEYGMGNDTGKCTDTIPY